MKITLEFTLGDSWATPAEFAEMSDEEIIELYREDPWYAMEGAKWTIHRPKDPETS